MKKSICASVLAASLIFGIPVHAYDKEILFREIPWLTTYKDVKNLMPDNNFYPIYGANIKKYPVDDVLYGVFKGDQPDNYGMNVIGSVTPQIDVAGYTTSDVDMYFVFDVSDEEIDFEVDNAKLYGASYTFEAENVDGFTGDMLSKLKSIYGEPDNFSEGNDSFQGSSSFYHWSGNNDTELVLKSFDREDNSSAKDEVHISYAWRGADDLLFEASDIIGELNAKDEAEKYGSSDISGL